MTTFKNYLCYRLKKSMLFTVAFSLIALVVSLTVVSESTAPIDWNGTPRTGIESLATIMGIVASLIPMIETADFKNRRNLDTLYFLPLSRFKLALAHYLSGLVQMTVIYTVAFIGHALALLPYAAYFRLWYLPIYYVLLLVLGVAIYSIFIFLFGEANSTADGVICSVMWIFALYLVALVAVAVIREYVMEYVVFDKVNPNYAFAINLENFATWFIPYAPINNLTVVFQNVMEGKVSYIEFEGAEKIEEMLAVHIWPTFGEVIEERYPQWYMVFPWLAAGVASTFGYFRTFTRKGAQQAGEISDSWFCYKLLIPLYGFSLLSFMGVFSFTTVFVIAAMYLGYAIYRRSFKIKKADIFAMVGTVAAEVALAIVLTAFRS